MQERERALASSVRDQILLIRPRIAAPPRGARRAPHIMLPEGADYEGETSKAEPNQRWRSEARLRGQFLLWCLLEQPRRRVPRQEIIVGRRWGRRRASNRHARRHCHVWLRCSWRWLRCLRKPRRRMRRGWSSAERRRCRGCRRRPALRKRAARPCCAARSMQTGALTVVELQGTRPHTLCGPTAGVASLAGHALDAS